jgi:copper homeostasis protein
VTGVRDLHAAPRRPAGTALGGDVSYAGVGVPSGFDHFETDPDEVAALCAFTRRSQQGRTAERCP